MSELPDRGAQNRCIAAALGGLAAYFGALLVPNWWPGFAGTGVFFVYFLSIPVVLVLLFVLFLWGLIGFASAQHDAPSATRRHAAMVIVPMVGALMLGASLGLARLVKRGLPTGSHLSDFDRAAWHDPRSSQYVEADITVRQKMLGSVVGTLDPSLNRTQIEALLGQSLDTPYFASTGRDMIYVLGPERGTLFSIDSEWLLIWLDDNGHFERFAIYTD